MNDNDEFDRLYREVRVISETVRSVELKTAKIDQTVETLVSESTARKRFWAFLRNTFIGALITSLGAWLATKGFYIEK